MKFSQLKKGSIIARVENYKVESAKVINIEKTGRDEYRFTVQGTETKKKYTFKVNGNHCTMCGFSTDGPERYYADGTVVDALRDGIEIGFKEARSRMNDSLKEITPFFTVGGRPVE